MLPIVTSPTIAAPIATAWDCPQCGTPSCYRAVRQPDDKRPVLSRGRVSDDIVLLKGLR